MLLVGPALDPEIGEQVGRFDSRLYARDFSHRFRKAGDDEQEIASCLRGSICDQSTLPNISAQ